MRILSTSAIALIAAAGFTGSALAADVLDRQYEDKYADQPAGVRVNWTGFYVGGAIGYGNANHDLTAQDYFKDFCDIDGDAAGPLFNPFEDDQRDDRDSQIAHNNGLDCTKGQGGGDTSVDNSLVLGDSVETANLDGLNSTGLVGDVRVGYDQQVGNRFLLGVFGTYGFSSMDADGSVAGAGSFELERGDDWSAGIRAGVLVNDSTLLYALAGYTQTEYDLSATDGVTPFSQTTTFDGIVVGGGIEFALSQNVFLGVEGTHAFYDEETIFDDYDDVANVGTSVKDDLGETKIMGTLKIKLNSDLY